MALERNETMIYTPLDTELGTTLFRIALGLRLARAWHTQLLISGSRHDLNIALPNVAYGPRRSVDAMWDGYWPRDATTLKSLSPRELNDPSNKSIGLMGKFARCDLLSPETLQEIRAIVHEETPCTTMGAPNLYISTEVSRSTYPRFSEVHNHELAMRIKSEDLVQNFIKHMHRLKNEQCELVLLHSTPTFADELFMTYGIRPILAQNLAHLKKLAARSATMYIQQKPTLWWIAALAPKVHTVYLESEMWSGYRCRGVEFDAIHGKRLLPTKNIEQFLNKRFLLCD